MSVDYSYIANSLNEYFEKIKISGQSIDKEVLKRRLTAYYSDKFNNHFFYDKSYEFIDLFCSAGGLSVGLEQEGFIPTVAVDNDPSAISTYRFNRPWLSEENIINDDIRKVLNNYTFPHVPLIVGGPPCQGFSVVNKHKKANDERNELYKFYVRTVKQSLPDIFLIENVEGILKLYRSIENDFKKIGYITCKPVVINTKDFGFPQSRKRAFILGVNKKYKKISSELFDIFNEGIANHLNKYNFVLWDAIGDLPEIKAKTVKNATYIENKEWGFTFAEFQKNDTKYQQLINCNLPKEVPLLNHRSKYNNARDIQIYNLLKPGEKSDAESIKDINPYLNRADIFRDKFDKLVAAEPCKAITAHMYYDCNMYIHPTQARGLSPREAARVQGFPDDYMFLGSPNEWYRQIGNAVSPLMARVLGIALRQVLERIGIV